MQKHKYPQSWDLDSLFKNSGELAGHITHTENLIDSLEADVEKAKIHNPYETKKLLDSLGDIRIHLSQASSFTTCLIAQDPRDPEALSLQGIAAALNARYDKSEKLVQSRLTTLTSNAWEQLLESEEFKDYRFLLTDWRKKAKRQLPEKEEKLLADLSGDGYHAWGQFYQTLMSSIKLSIPMDGMEKEMSVGQAINLRSHPDRIVRKMAHDALEGALKEKEELFAKILNHIAGFRLEMYKSRGIENVLEVPLHENRISKETLDAMWSAITNYKAVFAGYLNLKANLFGTEKLESYDFWAPSTSSHQEIPFDEAADLITEHFGTFSTEMKDFARHAFENGWIEAEDRSGKAGSAFCAGFPLSGESRIFMTYGGRITNVLTLAHELGHAFHNHALRPIRGMNRYYPLSLAETASTFSELVLLNAAYEKADCMEDKRFILDEKLKRSVMNFMNIHARFLFEERFFRERKSGYVPAERLNRLMQEAMDEAYMDSFGSPSVRSWIWTPHFYLTKSPFYNFPYTFGYLFSQSIYAAAKTKGPEFEKSYKNLLRDSGKMTAEELVMEHLGEDITTRGFWEKGLQLCAKDAEEFLTLDNRL
ncbi:pantothenate kinase [Neobacillus piezotolerans]|uniref:Pantothenate kinase n=1 Tax=Neobacillus piezotolerans TaxID=2259171 RepID=A0A3D8GLI2_9BACI|nr:M3 family oligoendopeptidase [Neobacillus piezotolerans]RDU35330.1 pantothenate kinase [Neobacillus piezotolerans]